jgi:chorismate dehydratase
MVKISVVSYLNATPFVNGLQNTSLLPDVEIALDTPALCAQKLLNNESDIGLVPVAILPKLNEYHILSDYCIGAKGNVGSVMLYSNVDLANIKTVLLDYQSKTSVMLAQILAKEYWKINPAWENAKPNYIDEIKGKAAGVVIGDRTFNLNGKYKFEYDLAGEWKKLTDLPFVFACWVANKKLPDDFISRFNEAIKNGVENIPSVIIEQQARYPETDVKKYLTESISYEFDEQKKQALEKFLSFKIN